MVTSFTQYLPKLSLIVSSQAIFGISLLLGLAGGEITRKFRWIPKISGYIAVGFVIGPGGFNLIKPSLINDSRIFVDTALGFLFFELGRYLDFIWIKHDKGLILMALSESILTLSLTFVIFYLAGFSSMSSTIIATIAMASSPAVIMLIAKELSSNGPITRRTLFLTSLNNLFALILFSFLVPMTQSTIPLQKVIIFHSIYRLCGSFILGLIMFVLTKCIAIGIGKHKENQFILLSGIIILTISLAKALNLSTMLTLFSLGIAARNFDPKHRLLEIELGWLAQLFFITLFVIIGVRLHFHGLKANLYLVFLLIFSRILAKLLGIMLFAKKCRLTSRQAVAIWLALAPMAEVAIGMSNTLTDFNLDLGTQLETMLSTVIAILFIVGPISTQLAFTQAGEIACD